MIPGWVPYVLMATGILALSAAVLPATPGIVILAAPLFAIAGVVLAMLEDSVDSTPRKAHP